MTKENIISDLERLTTTYRKLFLDIPNYKEFETTISWNNYKPAIYKNLYVREYEQLLIDKQYSFLLADKSFIQFYYAYNESNELTKAKLAYYPYPLLLKEEVGDIEHYYDEGTDMILQEYYYDLWNVLNAEFNIPLTNEKALSEFTEIMKKFDFDIDFSDYALSKFENKYRITNSSHIRIDYDSQVATHHKCEMQIEAVNYIRFPLNKLISPFLFFEFIVRNLSLKFKSFENYSEITQKSTFSTNYSLSKRMSKVIDDFNEDNIYIKHD